MSKIKGTHYKPKRVETKCYNCNSKDVKSMKSPAWTSQWKCNDCKKYNFVVYADFMSGALNEDVFVDDKPYNI